MKYFQKAMVIIAEVAKVICMIATAGLVIMIVSELVNRNLFGKSFRASIEICGILFLWMAFIGLIPLFQDRGLMRLDFLVSRIKEPTACQILFLFSCLVSCFLGVIMVLAYRAYYPFICNRYYSTFKILIPYSVQYFPLAVAGGYIAVNALGNAIITLVELFTGKNRRTSA